MSSSKLSRLFDNYKRKSKGLSHNIETAFEEEQPGHLKHPFPGSDNILPSAFDYTMKGGTLLDSIVLGKSFRGAKPEWFKVNKNLIDKAVGHVMMGRLLAHHRQ